MPIVNFSFVVLFLTIENISHLLLSQAERKGKESNFFRFLFIWASDINKNHSLIIPFPTKEKSRFSGSCSPRIGLITNYPPVGELRL
ncbi:MAG: hypothetical protein A3A94_00225 [Candidatus Portnoybacteria bacterium RIFCSPLOWO2_01_FULL_43_11]|uniref:Uncharacterized protein n=2 Tax=Candidatus Portnoyibacteriota TaxID=1817913 RepID=A0A1G2FQX6_9BACT|nr:MAG: hypothetical protein A3A94_00225 [Candidatus Portnoybacteria bacterium RIFCSPLOWO2_01_FULL_43_11]OGZ40494.1 MAG: hypothetical protein A3I20_00390 [Candidatus Portnoybacteria bacterium RIFCSPLOWO2_02_FULL_40_15]